MRYVWIIGGILATGLGLVGILLPIMPTVPFMILAAFCFGRSSPRLHAYMLDHPVYGPHIRDWNENGAIRRGAKWLATASMAGSIALSSLLGLPPHLIGIQAAVIAAALVFIWTRPSQ